MSSSSMWPARSRQSKQQQYKLPRWQPSMAASIIPPPIVSPPAGRDAQASIVLPTRSVVLEKPQAADTRESQLQADLQFLLDAQAEGLVRGVDADDRSSTGSVTPTTRSLRSDVPHQVNRPVRRKVGLRSARKGIYNCILALSEIKDEELDTTERALQATDHDLDQIQAWETKKKGLEEAAAKFDDTEETVRIQRLKAEAGNVQEEIVRIEAHLSEMKAKHRSLLKQAAAVENSVQAKLATYTSSLSILELDIKRFLSSKPRHRPVELDGNVKQSVWQLPPQRRTLGLAREQIKAESKELQEQAEAIRIEKNALDDGAIMWKDVGDRVTAFERQLRAEMARLTPAMIESTRAWDDTAQDESRAHMMELYGQLKALIEDLDSKLHTAEEKGWRLLIAAIGAELDALERGKDILAGVVGDIDVQDDGQTDELIDTSSKQNGHQTTGHDKDDSRHDTDEEPDPDLLFSVQDDNDD